MSALIDAIREQYNPKYAPEGYREATEKWVACHERNGWWGVFGNLSRERKCDDSGDGGLFKETAERVARLTSLERLALAAEDCDSILAEVEYLKPDVHHGPEGERIVAMDEATWEAILEDVARVRAAYREAAS